MSEFDDRVRPAREALGRAADRLGIRVTLEGASLIDAERNEHPVVAIVHDFGGPSGKCLFEDTPDKHLAQLASEQGYGWTTLGGYPPITSYDLDDWVAYFEEDSSWWGEGAPPAWHGVAVVHAAFSPNGRLVVTAGRLYEGTARIWETASGGLLHTLEGHTAWIESVLFSPDGRLVVTAAGEDGARIWDAASGRHLHALEANAWSAAFSPDSSMVITADGAARVWEAASGRILHTLEADSVDVDSGGAFSPDGRLIVTAGIEDGKARIWEAASGRLLHTLEVCRPSVETAVFSPDGSLVVTASLDGAKIWEAASGRLLHTLKVPKWAVEGAVFSPDGTKVLVRTDEGAQIWDAASGHLLHTLESPSYEHVRGRFGPDGKPVVTLSDPPFDAPFSPDGKLVVTPYHEGQARIWEAASGRPLHTLEVHGHSIREAVFSPDSRRIVTASSDGAGIWEVASGRLLNTLRPQQAP